jgi:hypothetical protein
MKSIKIWLALGAIALVVLVLPFGAGAHPSLYNIVGKVAKSPEIQTITITNATGGSFKPSAGAKTIPFNAPAWQVQDALGADPDIGRTVASGQANVLVTGPAGGPYTLRYQGTLVTSGGNVNMATTDRPQVVPDGTLLEGAGATVGAATNVAGGLPDIRFQDDPTGASLPDDVLRTVIPNDGYVMTFIESNGLATNGWLNLRFMPGGYRRPAAPGIPMTESEWLNWPMAQTGIQSHATCQGVPGLNTEENTLAVQSNENDPFWNYVPFQATSAGLGDEPEQWIPVVEDETGVDLTNLTTPDQLRTACEGIGGVFVPADSPAFPANAAVADAVAAAIAPLNTMIADLEAEIDALTNRPLSVQLSAQNSSNRVVAMVTGPLSEGVTVQLRIGAGMAQNLGIPQTIDVVAKQFGAKGAALVTLAPSGRAANRLSGRPAFGIVVRAVSGGEESTASGKLKL